MLNIVAAVALLPRPALAEGSSDTGNRHRLRGDVTLFVDVLADGERIQWAGEVVDPAGGPAVPVSLEVRDQTGALLTTTLVSGEETGPLSAGTYQLRMLAPDLDGDGIVDKLSTYEVTVPGATGGRLWSQQWFFETVGFGEPSAYNGSFYALVDGGAPGTDSVVELQANGVVGKVFVVKVNDTGLLHYEDQSAPIGFAGPNGLAVAVRQFPVYLEPPEAGTYSAPAAQISGVASERRPCLVASPGEFVANVRFDSSVSGRSELWCDLDASGGDSPGDLHVRRDAEVGENRFRWDGLRADGSPVPDGTYACTIEVRRGEAHFVARDIETAFPGFRMFEVTGTIFANDHVRAPAPMWWDDTLVQAGDVLMPNGQEGLQTSPPGGVASDYTDPALPNVNTHAWGNFTRTSKGDDALLDSYTVLGRATAALEIEVLSPATDTDRDGLGDADERCRIGTDATRADTDADGLDDGFEELESGSDPLLEDTDGDGLLDGMECDASDPRQDTDGFGRPDWADTDDDGDHVPTADEDWNGNGDFEDDDLDGDRIPAWLDNDDDGDGRIREDLDGDGDPSNDDSDGDGDPNVWDADDDGDGIPNADERAVDSDGDGDRDWFDDDDDGDGYPTRDEGTRDADNDGRPDYLDRDDDGDGVPTVDEFEGDTDGDGTVDAYDDDDDGDRIPTATDGEADYDEDGVPNYLDTDSDDDGIPDQTENAPGGRYVGTNSDNDFRPDYRDQDDDGDGVSTLEEAGRDTDGDQKSDHLEKDDDNDGISTRLEVKDGFRFGNDPDDDGLENWIDDDSDGDGLTDRDETRFDAPGDGNTVPEYLDPLQPEPEPLPTGEYLGGSCDQSGSPAGLLPLALAPLLLRRRRAR